MTENEKKDILIQLLKQELTKEALPQNFRDILSKTLQVLSHQNKDLDKLRQERDKFRKEAEHCETKSLQLTNYVKAAEDNYNALAKLYKGEHTKTLDQQEQIIQYQTRLKELGEEQTARELVIRQQIEHMKQLSDERVEKQREEYTKSANKQAMGRRNIEEKLMHKDAELNDLKKRLQDLETRFNHLEAQKQEKVNEADFYKKENSQLKLLVAYLQPQQLQAQNQTHIQTLPQPPHNPRY
ncbi:uncharacterized protein EV154DRAFT_568826 [Mucor mucedo]|uniref:uncharacterized protein n=1 Tax=Mucor mucedo TaxID=29922 RepID=UPI00222018EC|nr:uncharacterized protein EV154DRAFT_568826 [Mucor mucedo]KAI7878715.1 hypothetical protein EV154DRAFT_568826 [Mucor mucedo]